MIQVLNYSIPAELITEKAHIGQHRLEDVDVQNCTQITSCSTMLCYVTEEELRLFENDEDDVL